MVNEEGWSIATPSAPRGNQYHIEGMSMVANPQNRLVQVLENAVYNTDLERFLSVSDDGLKDLNKTLKLCAVKANIQALQLWQEVECVRAKACSAILGLCGSVEAGIELSKLGVVDVMIQICLRDDVDSVELLSIFQFLRRIASASSDTKCLETIVKGIRRIFNKREKSLPDVVHQIAISTLVEILNSAGSPDLLVVCYLSFWTVLSSTNYKALLQTKGEAKILQTVQKFRVDEVVQYRGLGILRNLCGCMSEAERTSDFVKKTIAVFLDSLASQDKRSEVVEQALGMLKNLMHDSPTIQAQILRDKRVVNEMMRICPLHKRKQEIQTKILQILDVLSSLENSSVLNADGMIILLGIIVRHKELQKVGIAIFDRFLQRNNSADVTKEVCDHVHVVIETMRSFSDCRSTQLHGVSILRWMSAREEYRHYVYNANGFFVLWDTMLDHPPTAKTCCATLLSLTEGRHFQGDSLNTLHRGHVKMMYDLIERNGDEDLVETAMVVLRRFASLDCTGSLFPHLKVIQVMFTALHQHSRSLKVTQLACAANHDFLKKDDSSVRNVDNRVINRIVGAMDAFPDDHMIQLCCCESLHLLSAHHQRAMATSNVSERALRLLQNEKFFAKGKVTPPFPEVGHAALALLKGLSSDAKEMDSSYSGSKISI